MRTLISIPARFQSQANELARQMQLAMDDYDLVADPSFPQRKLKEWGLRTARPRM